MSGSSGYGWVRTAVACAALYAVVAITFPLTARRAAASEMPAWRLVAWLVSGSVFAAHVAYEHFRQGNSPFRTALHVASAVAAGAFLLAAWINVRHWADSTNHGARALLALVVFPLVTGTPAFAAALEAGSLLGRKRRPRGGRPA